MVLITILINCCVYVNFKGLFFEDFSTITAIVCLLAFFWAKN